MRTGSTGERRLRVSRSTTVYAAGALRAAWTAIWIADLERGDIATISTGVGTGSESECEPFATISPDGRQLAFIVPA